MIRIEVHSTEIREFSGVSKVTGKPFFMRKQEAWAHLYGSNGQMAPFPVRIELTLEDNQQPYPSGEYTLAPPSLYVDRFGGLTVGRPQLIKPADFMAVMVKAFPAASLKQVA
jgi:hypothetical protein